MAWQDRDYARHDPPPAYTYRVGAPSFSGGFSIVTTLIVINVGVFLLAMFSPALERLIYGIGVLQADAVIHGQIWRLITAQYLHAGMGHLFINMLVLHFLGRPLEMRWSPRKFFVIYTLCGLAGNVFYTVLGAMNYIDPQMPAVGASGCIYGLLGIVAVMFPHATVYIYFLFPLRIRTAALIFGGIAFLTVLQRGANFGGEACHLAGLVFGAWWAWKGESWWRQTGWRLSDARSSMRRSGPAGSFEERVAQRRADAATVDRILKKVYDQGIHSLTESEKRALQEATERQRQRDQEWGRMDRL